MMQYVATAKSEVAAFATGSESNSFKGSESNEQFGKLLQDQTPLDRSPSASEAPPPHSPRKTALQQSLDEIETVPSSGVTQGTTKTHDAQTSSSSQGTTAIELANKDGVSDGRHVGEDVDSVSESESDAHPINDELKDGNTKSAVESASIATQEWVSLIDDLKKLADIARSTKQPSVDVEVGSIDVSESDLKLDSKIPQSISVLIDEAIENVLTHAEDGLTDVDVQQKVAELLLETPGVLQDLISKLQINSQETDADTSEQKTLNTAIDPDVQVDLTLAENKALLRTLLVDSDIGENPVAGPVKSAEPVLPDTLEKLTQSQQNEALLTKLESVAEQGELLEQDSQMAQVATSDLLQSSKVEKVSSNNDINNIVNLSDSKLDKVLENIAQRVFDSKHTDGSITSEQIAEQVIIPKASEISSSVGSSSKDFISALKSGIEEYKNQLSQGREPGIDLKALVSDALATTTDSGVAAKAPINLEQMVNRVSQVLDLAQTINRAIEHQHDQVYSATLRDAAQIQGEQSKQIQLNQFESKFEKAINIAKPEGHQQLVEKVRWMVNTKNLVAEIRLDPAELGSVHVKVAVSGESATVNFVVQSQQARDAVDTATPRLREMLAEKGIELGQSSVRQESDGQQEQGDGESARQGDRGMGDTEDMDVPEQVLAQQNIINGALGGIDYFV
jgi:flagellar hook-length control protein FliK